MLKQIQNTFYIILLFCSIISINGQSVTATYSSGDIPTGDLGWPGGCTASTLTLSVPIGATITGVDVSYDMTALEDVTTWDAYMSEQRSQLYYQEGTVDEGTYYSGVGGFAGTYNYTRTGTSFANGLSATGILTFEMRAYRTWSGISGCNLTVNKVDNNTWTITVYYTTPLIETEGYLGPGGVGHTDGSSDLELWLMANKDVTSNGSDVVTDWIDNSGNGNDVTTIGGDPTYTATINGYEVISLDGTDHFLSNVTSNTSTKASTYVAATITGFAGHTWAGVLSGSKNGQLDWNTTDHVVFLSRNSGTNELCAQRSGLKSRFTDGILPNSNVKIMGSEFNGINNIVRFNGLAATAVSSSGAFNFNLIGIGKRITENKYTVGNYGEVIYFSNEINLAEKFIIENYLQAKYNGTIDASIDFYDEDTSGEDFDHKVAGIGQATDGSNHTDSQGTGIVRINTPSSLSNDDFLFWGEDVKDANYEFSTSPSSDYIERLDTKWRVSKRNDLGTVNVSIKETDITLNSTDGCNALKLIVSNSSTFATKTTYNLVLSGGIYAATGVSFSDNDYFTLEYIDTIVIDATTAYNGDGASNVPDISDDCYKLLVKSTADGTPSLTEDADVREIEVEAGGILAIDTGYRLKVTNGINNNGDIRLVGTSQLVQTHATATNLNTGSGNLYVDQTASTSTVYQSGYWSSPVRKLGTAIGTDFAINDVLKDGSVATAATPTAGEAVDIDFISGYDGDASSSPIKISERWLAKLIDAADWTRFVDPTAAIFKPAQGWNMKSVGATFTFKGIPNDGTYTSSISQNNYSLLGNPYPSALDSEAFIADNLPAIKGTLYLYDSASDITHVRGDYTGAYSTIVSGVTIGGGRYLPIGQAFFVTREDAGTGTITFQNTQRPTNIALGDTADILAKNDQKQKTENKYLFPILRLGFEIKIDEDFTYKREVAVAFRGLTQGYENGFDGEMFDKKPSDLGLKIEERDYPFVISSIEDFDVELEIPLHLELDRNGEVNFTINKLENLEDIPVILNDRLTNSFYDLSKEDALLDLMEGTYSDRFFITFKDEVLSLEEELLNASFTIFQNASEKKLLIKNINNKIISNISVYTLTGQKIIDLNDNEVLKNAEITFKTNKMSTSIYIINIITSQGVISKKILIQ